METGEFIEDIHREREREGDGSGLPLPFVIFVVRAAIQSARLGALG